MKQIKNLIRKKVFLYIESNNIKMDDDFNEKYLSKQNYKSLLSPKNKIKKQKASNNIDTILEEESNFDKSNLVPTTNRYKDQSTSAQTKSIKIPIPDIYDSKLKTECISKISSKKKVKRVFFKSDVIDKEEKMKTEIKERSDINGVNDVINLLDKKVIKSSKNNNLINNFNINIYTPKVQFPLNQINIENQSSNIYEIKKEESNKEKIKEISNDSFISNKINKEISFNKDFIMNIKDNDILMNNSDENSNVVLTNIKLNDNKNTNISDNYSSNIIKLLDKKKLDKKPKNEKIEIKTNDNISIKSESSDKSKISKSRSNSNEDALIIKMNKFSNLNASQSTSFSIKSIYENFNQISQYKLEKSPDLREKAKKFILEQIEEDKKEKLQAFSKTSKNNNNFLSIKYNMNLNNSKKTLSRLSSENYERSNISSKNIVNKTGLVKKATLQFDESKL